MLMADLAVNLPNDLPGGASPQAATMDDVFGTTLADGGSPGDALAEYAYLGIGWIVQEDYPEPELRLDYDSGTPGEYAGFDAFGRVVDHGWYAYDLFNRRVAKTVAIGANPADPEDVSYFIHDGERGERGNAGDHLVLVFDGHGDLTNRYLHGPAVDQILADEQVDSLTTPGEVLWPLTDNLGTVRDLAVYDDATGITAIVNHLTYNAFGEITDQTDPTVPHRFAFTGREWDEDAGLYYYRARWYDPELGRWLSEDPIGFAASDANLYRYVKNVPTVYVDPSGLQHPDAYFVGDGRQGVLGYPPPPKMLGPSVLAVYRTTSDRLAEEYRQAANDFPNEQDIQSWCHFISTLRGHSQRHGLITELWVLGHGGSNEDYIGQWLGEDIQFMPQHSAELRPFLARDATIFLMGCAVGLWQEYALAAANNSNAHIVAATAFQTYHIDEQRGSPDFDLQPIRQVLVRDDDGRLRQVPDPEGRPGGYLRFSPGANEGIETHLPNPWPYRANDSRGAPIQVDRPGVRMRELRDAYRSLWPFNR